MLGGPFANYNPMPFGFIRQILEGVFDWNCGRSALILSNQKAHALREFECGDVSLGLPLQHLKFSGLKAGL